MSRAILITTSSFNTELPQIGALARAGFEVRTNPYGRKLSAEEASALLTNDIVGMIAGVEPLTRTVLSGASNLRVISRCGAGLDTVDLAAAQDLGIRVCNTPDAPAAAVAELALALMLACLRHVPIQDRAIRAGRWDRPMGGLLGARTVGLIGYGRIGQRVARLVEAFGARTLYHDMAHPKSLAFGDVLAQADIVTLHRPYEEADRHLINANALAGMKKGAILINTARGGLVDESALAESLRSGHIGAAGFDVFEQEPYLGSLAGIENVVMTPHIGSYARETREMQEIEAAENLVKHLLHKEKRHGAL